MSDSPEVTCPSPAFSATELLLRGCSQQPHGASIRTHITDEGTGFREADQWPYATQQAWEESRGGKRSLTTWLSTGGEGQQEGRVRNWSQKESGILLGVTTRGTPGLEVPARPGGGSLNCRGGCNSTGHYRGRWGHPCAPT